MTKASTFRVTISTLAILATLVIVLQGRQTAAPPQAPLQNTMVRAPEFPANADWLNTDKPLSIRALKGKIVLLDFWTYCCINCMHILPDLKKLERKYPNELVIIGVHSAKFDNEGETASIRNAIMRYKIEHPVLNDSDLAVWKQYAIHGWPTQVLIDPTGRIVLQESGEGHYEDFDGAIAKLVKDFKARGELREGPTKLALEAAKTVATPLSFPGKILADGDGKRLFIADSNHNRVIVTDLQGNVQSVAGSGVEGFEDGTFTAATFHNPQGLCLSEDGNTLYVADTDNHAVRALNLQNKSVITLAGTGKQGSYRTPAGLGIKTPLSSPWDVTRNGHALYIALAGCHQVWSLNLDTNRVTPYAGTGAEARYDAGLTEAALAQPSGIVSSGNELFFADSESSSIRRIALPGGSDAVTTLVGGDPSPGNLFAFGDRSGKGFEARLQHPLGIAYDGNQPAMLYVADTYNHKIKVMSVADEKIMDLAGTKRGEHDGGFGEAAFNEPGGLSALGDSVYVADTNNNAIRVLDLKTRRVSTLTLKNLPQAKPAEPEREADATDDDEPEGLAFPIQTIAPGKGELIFDVALPKGYHLNKEAPLKWEAEVQSGGLKLSQAVVKGKAFKLPLRVGFTASPSGTGAVVIDAQIYYCTDDMGICKVRPVLVKASFKIAEGGAKTLKISTKIGADDDISMVE